MPYGIYSQERCNSKKEHDKFIPTIHQQETVDYFMNSKYKGLLLYHKVGSGKTCTSLLIADKMLRRDKRKEINNEEPIIKKVYILSPGSLRKTWINEYCNVCGYKKEYISKYFIFITYNFAVSKRLPKFDNSLVIIDEVHNLINGVKNISPNFTIIYDSLMKANCKILALSGTPVYNYVYEFALLGNLLKPGGEFPEIRKNVNLENKTGSIDKYAFMKFFQDENDGILIPLNETSFRQRLSGIISYYPGAGEEFVPKIIEEEIIKVQMTYSQELNYWKQQEQESAFAFPPNKSIFHKDPKKYELLKKLYIMAMKNILIRSASNFYYPDKFKEEKDLLKDEGGWIKKKYFTDGNLYKLFSTKITALLINIIAHNLQKHVLFTFFLNKAGVILIKTLLNMCGISAEIFSGNLDDSGRGQLLKRFNSPQNKYGDIIRVLLVTEAGSEGISVLEARHMHILESSPRMSKTIQAIGRVARYKSHINLPKNERNVKIWRYWSIASPEKVKLITTIMNNEGKEETIYKDVTNKICIDEILYDKGMKTIREISSFLDILKSVSVTKFTDQQEEKNLIENIL
jgi:superfamily II DNA or RNA helicase